MSLATKDNGKKWIQASVAILCMILVYVLISFFTQIGEWFLLESKIKGYLRIVEAVSVLISLGVFVGLMKNPKSKSYLNDVYQEAIKVVWPDKNETVRHTIGIMIGVTIVGFLLGLFDLIATWLLAMIN